MSDDRNKNPGNVPAAGGASAPALDFPGVRVPGTDFAAVRNQLRTRPQYYDVDLSAARSIAAQTGLILPLQGNTLYIDQRAGSGFAQVRFEDVSPNSTPITIYPGANFKIPFSQVAIENAAQPGLSLRLIYGTDLDLVPGTAGGSPVIVASPTSGLGLQTTDQGDAYGTSFVSVAARTANVPENVIAAVTNVNGYIIKRGQTLTMNNANYASLSVLAKASAPTSVFDNDILALNRIFDKPDVNTFGSWAWIDRPLRVAAGKRLDTVTQVNDASLTWFLYTLV